MNLTVRPMTAADYEQARPMLINLGFADDEAALAERYPNGPDAY